MEIQNDKFPPSRIVCLTEETVETLRREVEALKSAPR